MSEILGIINFESNAVEVSGLSDYRGIPSLSFMGRYRIIDFVLSNMSNSAISNIHIHVRGNSRSISEHVGTGRHFNINSKRGSLHVFSNESEMKASAYHTDISSMSQNLEFLSDADEQYVLIAPSYFVYSFDYNDLLAEHLKSNADISMLYKSTDNANEVCIGCDTLSYEKDGCNPDLRRVVSIGVNRGKHKNRSISLECYLMRKSLLLELLKEAREISPFYWLKDIIREKVDELAINGVALRHPVRCINSLESYYTTHMNLIDQSKSKAFFREDWPIFTRTSDSPPTLYNSTARVKNSTISNGSMIMGTVENSIIGRNVVIEEGAVVRNSIILTRAHIASGIELDRAIVDKRAKVFNAKNICAAADDIIYIGRSETV